MNGEHTYAIKEPNDDPLSVVITKSGISVDFTVADMILEQSRCEKIIKELRGKLKLQEDTMANIEHHHEWVKDMDLKKLFTAHMYYEARALVEAIPGKIKELEEQLALSKEEQAKIAAATGLDVLPKTKEEAVDAAMARLEEAPPAVETNAPEAAPEAAPTEDEKPGGQG